jgi:hypothetical protein
MLGSWLEKMMLCLPSRDAWHAAREGGRDLSRSEVERTHWWRVSHVIERRAGIERESTGSG